MARRSCLAVLLLASLSFPAWAQQPVCAPFEAVSDALQRELGETPSTEGVSSSGSTLVMYANLETGTWTLVLIPKGRSDLACLIAAGTKFTRWPAPGGRGA